MPSPLLSWRRQISIFSQRLQFRQWRRWFSISPTSSRWWQIRMQTTGMFGFRIRFRWWRMMEFSLPSLWSQITNFSWRLHRRFWRWSIISIPSFMRWWQIWIQICIRCRRWDMVLSLSLTWRWQICIISTILQRIPFMLRWRHADLNFPFRRRIQGSAEIARLGENVTQRLPSSAIAL